MLFFFFANVRISGLCCSARPTEKCSFVWNVNVFCAGYKCCHISASALVVGEDRHLQSKYSKMWPTRRQRVSNIWTPSGLPVKYMGLPILQKISLACYVFQHLQHVTVSRFTLMSSALARKNQQFCSLIYALYFS